jgi:hypothetical protein
VSLNNVTFDAALRSILHANIPKLACDYRDGVFHVSVRKAVDPPSTSITTGSATGSYPKLQTALSTSGKRFYKVPIDHADVALMAMLLRSSKGVSVVPSATVGGNSGMIGRGGMGMGGNMGSSGMGMGGRTGMGSMGTGMSGMNGGGSFRAGGYR